jgi:hypothetical protein
MKSTEPPSLASLRALLHDAAAAPADAMAAIAGAREALSGDGPLAHELIAAELRWLAAENDAQQLPADELRAARREWLGLRARALGAAAPDAAVLCDLAEVAAAAAAAGEREIVAACERAESAALAAVRADTPVDQEAAERFALLSTAIDDLPIPHQVQLLGRTGAVLRALGQRTRSRTCTRLGRRLQRASGDRELARRLEARIGRRGVAWLETTNFVLLLVVLGTLLLEPMLDLSDAQLHALHWVDAIACSFFIADFLFELALHPARGSWFVRNAVTDLLPAIPAVLVLLPGPALPGEAGNVMLLRVLRLFRVTWAARYVQALRPLLRSARLVLFLVRGLDGLAARFQQVLNREFVFVPAAADVRRSVVEEDQRDLLFAALRREHELAALLPAGERAAAVQRRTASVRASISAARVDGVARRVASAGARDVPIGDAIEFLWSLRPQDVGRWLRPADVQSLDRVIRVLSAVPVRWLPIIRRVAVHPLPATPDERIVALGRRVAEWVESWHGRMLFVADLHGIVTGPQILDRVATAMVKASQRPAVRLLLFGGLFSVLRLFWTDNCLSRFVGLPLVLLGGVCLVFLSLGHWLKRLAGQAAESYRLTSEAQFLSQLERVKPRYEREDLGFLAARVFEPHHAPSARALLQAQVRELRTGVPVPGTDAPHWLCLEANRTALLYLHFLDGAPLHESDVKTTEQLLANQSLENLRQQVLRVDKREKKRLRRLKLDEGSILAGPFLWFRFITESLAVESAKRIAGYNRYCIPLAELPAAPADARAAMADWLQRRRDPRGGRTLKEKPAGAGPARGYPCAEFTALDFVGGDPERDRHIAALFGDEVLDVLRADRRTMVREIFGTRPVHNLPKHERSFNPLRFYQRRLSHGRVLLLPLLFGWRFVRWLGWLVKRVRQIVREVFDPELAMQRREIGEAPFAVALRKIHRMRAPGLLEATRMRLSLDPGYAGAPAGWSDGAAFAAEPPLERDIQFLHLREREAQSLRDGAAAVRSHVTALHAALAWLPPLDGGAARDADARAAGELAVSCAWIADQDGARTLLFAERWRAEVLPQLERQGARPSRWTRAGDAVRGLFVRHPVQRWLERHGRGLSPAARAALREAHCRDLHGARELIARWLPLPPGASPAEHAIAVLRRAFANGPAVRRDLMALRTVQSLAVLDIRNYRDLVFQLGDYASDGEDRALGGALP